MISSRCSKPRDHEAVCSFVSLSSRSLSPHRRLFEEKYGPFFPQNFCFIWDRLRDDSYENGSFKRVAGDSQSKKWLSSFPRQHVNVLHIGLCQTNKLKNRFPFLKGTHNNDGEAWSFHDVVVVGVVVPVPALCVHVEGRCHAPRDCHQDRETPTDDVVHAAIEKKCIFV